MDIDCLGIGKGDLSENETEPDGADNSVPLRGPPCLTSNVRQTTTMFDFLKRDKPAGVPPPEYLRFSLSEIEEEIKRKGYWEEFDEWRIFTTTSFRITPVEQLDEENQTKKLVYAVQVKCDYDLRCECPTLKRAIHFCEVFQKWIMKVFVDEGWPSWAEKTKLEAPK